MFSTSDWFKSSALDMNFKGHVMWNPNFFFPSQNPSVDQGHVSKWIMTAKRHMYRGYEKNPPSNYKVLGWTKIHYRQTDGQMERWKTHTDYLVTTRILKTHHYTINNNTISVQYQFQRGKRGISLKQPSHPSPLQLY